MGRAIRLVHARFADRADSEHEQAVIRLAITCLIIPYLVYSWLSAAAPAQGIALSCYTGFAFFFFSLAILAWIFARPGPSPVRRLVGMIGDMYGTTFCLFMGGAELAPLYIIYLWVTLGNGFRFGQRYMFASSLTSLACFTLVALRVDYWRHQVPLTVGLLTGLVVLPAYTSTLMRKLKRAHAKLADATARAEEANRAKSRFLANMSHELRTPLNGIMGMAELLCGTRLTTEQRDFANTIHDSSRMMVALVDDVLDFSKIEAGKVVIEKTEFDLHSLLRGTAGMLVHQAAEKGVRLTTVIAPDVPWLLHGDPVHLRQVLTNLLSNAVKFTEAGEIVVRVRSVADSGDAVTLRFEVKDTGIGMSPEQQARIFERFSQADESTTRKYGGTGLGTTISKQLVELMGGEIALESRPGEGTTFRFTIPFVRQAGRPADAAREEDGNLRFMVVSTDEAVIETLTRHLASWNLKVEAAHRGGLAFSKLVAAADAGSPFLGVIVAEHELDMCAAEFAKVVGSVKKIADTHLILVCAPGVVPDLDILSGQGYCVALDSAIDKTMLFNAIHFVRPDAPDADGMAFIANRYRQRHASPDRFDILVAEDNPVNQKVIRLILGKAGHTVRIVENGELALDALQAGHYDIALLDLNMPVMGGVEAAKMYRVLTPQGPWVPLVALTADNTVETRRRCDEARFDAYVSKPVESRKLLEVIAAVATRRPADAEISPIHGASAVREDAPPYGRADETLSIEAFDDLRAIGANDTFILNLMSMFMEETEKKFERMTAALRDRSPEDFRQLAHAMKGSAGQIGATALSKMAGDFSMASDETIRRDGGLLHDQMKIEYGLVRSRLEMHSRKIGIS
jgi:two-component system sensor histidine kinase RpfC